MGGVDIEDCVTMAQFRTNAKHGRQARSVVTKSLGPYD
jgi:hypothetical protein